MALTTMISDATNSVDAQSKNATTATATEDYESYFDINEDQENSSLLPNFGNI